MHEYHIMNTLTFSLVLSLVSESTKKPLFLCVCACESDTGHTATIYVPKIKKMD